MDRDVIVMGSLWDTITGGASSAVGYAEDLLMPSKPAAELAVRGYQAVTTAPAAAVRASADVAKRAAEAQQLAIVRGAEQAGRIIQGNVSAATKKAMSTGAKVAIAAGVLVAVGFVAHRHGMI